MGYNFVADNMGLSSIHLAVDGSKSA